MGIPYEQSREGFVLLQQNLGRSQAEGIGYGSADLSDDFFRSHGEMLALPATEVNLPTVALILALGAR